MASPIPWGRVSVYLSRATLDADDRGQGDIPVVIRAAPAAPPEDAYCILRLHDFAGLAKDAQRGREAVQTAEEP